MVGAKKSFHEIVAENLIKQLEAGTAPWQKPWKPGAQGFIPVNPTTGNRYKGINAIYLMAQGFTDHRWLTYKQAEAVGAQVRKGEKGTPIQYWMFSEEQNKLDGAGKPMLDAQGLPVKTVVMLERPRVFFATVFNGEQIDGLPSPEPKERLASWQALEKAECILRASGAVIRHGEQDRAFYRLASDSIHLPHKEQFPTADNYYATALHELGHWTGHHSRLDRDISHPFGSQGYAKEELKAECFSLIMGEELGVGHDPKQHAAYVGSWIALLKNDPLEIFRATADAEKMVNYVMAFEQKLVQEQGQEKTQIQAESPSTEQTQEVRQAPQGSQERIYLHATYRDKDEIKKLGACWDRQQHAWYIPHGVDAAPFAKWRDAQELPPAPQTAAPSKQYLAVAYHERSEAKAAGALWDNAAKSWYIGEQADPERLARWLPKNVQSQQDPAISPRDEFAEAMRSLGCIVDGAHPIMDGEKHRVATEGDKQGERAGFYVGHLDAYPSGYIANNRTGESMKWRSKGYLLEKTEKAQLQAQMAEKLASRKTELAQAQEAASARVSKQIAALVPVTRQTGYMKNKGIQPHAGILTDREGRMLYVPAYDENGKPWTMQYIQDDGTKRFTKNSRKEGCFHIVGGDLKALQAAPAIVIQEGYATAATNAEALGFATVVAFDAGNLSKVAKVLHDKFSDKPVVIFGDDDRHQELMHGTNPGKSKAQQAAQAVNGKAFFPIFASGEAEYPASLAPITPQTYREHVRALQLLETAPEERKPELQKALLSKEQLSALASMKKYTDFNDLAVKSRLGRDALERQVKMTVEKIVHEAQNLREQKVIEQHHEQSHSAQSRHSRGI
ncbi:MAG: zincin-like metallopeptidase domain-containing protein [Enterovibrio sp.]